MKKLFLPFAFSSFLLLCSFSPINTRVDNNKEVKTNLVQKGTPKEGDYVDAVEESTNKIVNVKIKCIFCLQCASVYAYGQAGNGQWYLIHTDLSSSTGWSGHAVDKPNC